MGPDKSDLQLLNAMMCAILERVRISDDESFFEMGGNSLSAARLAAHIATRLGLETTVQAIYEHPTAATLAQYLSTASPSPEPLKRQDRADLIPLAPVQRRLWFHNRLYPADASYNMVLAVRITGPLNVSALGGALADVVDRHEVLRTVYPDWEGTSQQVILTAEEIGFELSVAQTDRGDGVDLISAEADMGFDVTADGPMRALLIREAAGAHLLGLVIHHIACDGWSLLPLLADLAAAYRHRIGLTARPEPLVLQYADYALWRTRALASAPETVDQDLAFWRRELRYIPPVPVLDGMRPRRGAPSNQGAELRRRVHGDLHAALTMRSREMGASLFMVVHAALAVTMDRMGAGDDCVIGTPVAGRSDPELDPLIGFFVNTLALRVDLSGNPTFEGLVARVRSTDLAAFAHDRLPFDLVLQDLNPPRDAGWLPLFGVMLAFQNTPRPELNLPDLHCEVVVVPTRIARFDLRIEIVELHNADGPAGLDITCTWATDIATAGAAGRLLDLLEQVLMEAAEDPRRRLRRLGRSDGAPLDEPPLPRPTEFPRDGTGRPRIAFICSPFGQQWVGMAQRMLEQESIFAQAVDECRTELSKHVPWDLLEELARPAESSRIHDVTVGQPLVFAVQVALARWLENNGVVPTVVVGHSLGEISACVISGILDLSDAARLIYHYTQQQGRLVNCGGGMLLVEWPTSKLERYLDSGFSDLSIATENGPRTTALAGPRHRLERLKEELEARNVLCAWVRVNIAAHGPDIDSVIPSLVRNTKGIIGHQPRILMVSSVTGRDFDWRNLGPEYFARNLRERVRFAAAVQTVLDEPPGALVEVSANPILVPALEQSVRDADAPTHVLSSMRKSDPDDRVGPMALVKLLRG